MYQCLAMRGASDQCEQFCFQAHNKLGSRQMSSKGKHQGLKLGSGVGMHPQRLRGKLIAGLPS